MPALLLYLLKTQLALALLLAVYYGLLRQLTFHQLNRAYLLAALGLAALYPALDLGELLPRTAAAAAPLVLVVPAWVAAAPATPAATGPDYGVWLLAAYWAGVGLMALRLLVQAASLWRLHHSTRPAQVNGVAFQAVSGAVSPFSFGSTIYLNPARHSSTELLAILLHEQVHVRQAHTLDVVLGHLHRVLAWWSPAAWLWQRAVHENLEFIADAAVLRESVLPPQLYQYSLVQLSTQFSNLAPGPALGIPFSFITLKNRIRMMNSHASSRWQLLRYATALLLAVGLLTTAAAPAPPATATQSQLQDQMLYFVDGKRVEKSEVDKLDPKTIESLNILKGEAATNAFGPEAAGGAMLIVTKQNKNSAAVKAFMEQHRLVLAPAPPAVKPSLYFLDGQPSDRKTIDALNPRTIASVNVVKGPEAVQTFGPGAAEGVMIIVTKRNVSSEAVAEFNRRYHMAPPLVPAPPVRP